MSIQIATVLGARPQFIKASMLSNVIATTNGIEERIIHTGQHYDFAMSDIFFKELGLPQADINLNVGGLSHNQMIAETLKRLDDVFEEKRPDAVLVYGDTNSTLAGALAAAKKNIPVAHIEAGLRSFDRDMPEEQNRILTDHLSDALFCPTSTSLKNLEDEGLRERAHCVGDVMYDVHMKSKELVAARQSLIAEMGFEGVPYNLVTLHRQSNTQDREAIIKAMDYVDYHADGAALIAPLHPRMREKCQKFDIDLSHWHIIDPVGFLDMSVLLKNCSCVFTDSGGLQKEAAFFQKKCVTLRDNTEWTETIHCGWNRLWTQPDFAPVTTLDEYGDGNAAALIAARLLAHLG